MRQCNSNFLFLLYDVGCFNTMASYNDIIQWLHTVASYNGFLYEASLQHNYVTLTFTVDNKFINRIPLGKINITTVLAMNIEQTKDEVMSVSFQGAWWTIIYQFMQAVGNK